MLVHLFKSSTETDNDEYVDSDKVAGVFISYRTSGWCTPQQQPGFTANIELLGGKTWTYGGYKTREDVKKFLQPLFNAMRGLNTEE